MPEFETMGLKPALLAAIDRMRFVEPTDVQKEAIPVAMSGRSLVVRARTGTGKTGAFLIPIIQTIKVEDKNSVLILVPTRELALQVTKVADGLSFGSGLRITSVYGGVSMFHQIKDLRNGVNIIIGTPGRVIDLMKQGELRTDKIKILVLDEADTMFDMGFIDDITYIISKLPKNRQSMLFSATMPKAILEIAKKHMDNPVYLSVGKEEEVTVSSITHYYAVANGREKFPTLLAYIEEYKPNKAIIFVQTKRNADYIHDLLKRRGLDVTLMHGGLSQARREYSLSDFRRGTRFLIATNVAARGLDIRDVSDVISLDATDDPLIYIHRVGRSARMGADGRAFTIFSNAQRYLVREIERIANIKMHELEFDLAPYRPEESLDSVYYKGRQSNPDFRQKYGQDRDFKHKGPYVSGRYGQDKHGHGYNRNKIGNNGRFGHSGHSQKRWN